MTFVSLVYFQLVDLYKRLHARYQHKMFDNKCVVNF